MKAAMARFDPSDAERLEAFLRKLRPIYEAVITEGLGAVPSIRWARWRPSPPVSCV